MQQISLEKEKQLTKVELLFLIYVHKLKRNGISIENVAVDEIIETLSITHCVYYKTVDKLSQLNLIEL